MKNVLFKAIERHTTISFDVFDTLIVRNVSNPTDIFKLVDAEFNSINNKKINYYKERLSAENKARKKATNGEVTLNEIYDEFQNCSDAEKDKLKQIEIKTEYSYCQRNNSIDEAFKYSIKTGKKIFLITDMYLPKTVICTMLEKCGYQPDTYEDIYVSCEYKCNKVSGELFKIVEETGKVKKPWLHIGDSIKADFLGAIKAGVDPYLVHRNNRLRRYYSHIKEI